MGLFFVFVSNLSITERDSFSAMQITGLMMGVDLIALLVGLLFGRMMKSLSKVIRFLPPTAYLIAFMLLSAPHGLFATITALVLIGLANGVGVPYLNTAPSITCACCTRYRRSHPISVIYRRICAISPFILLFISFLSLFYENR